MSSHSQEKLFILFPPASSASTLLSSCLRAPQKKHKSTFQTKHSVENNQVKRLSMTFIKRGVGGRKEEASKWDLLVTAYYFY